MVTIKAAAALAGLTVKAVRHYESLGLVTPSARTAAGYRLYSDEDIFRLSTIQYFRELKFPLQEVAKLLDAPQEEIRAALELQRQSVAQQMEEFRRAQAILDVVLAAEHTAVAEADKPKLAIVATDLQNDILEGGALSCKRILNILPPLRKLFAEARAMDVPVIYVCDRHFKGDPELQLWNDHMMAGSWGAQIIDEVAPHPGDHIVYKNRFNGFVDTDLQDVLQRLQIDTVLMAGWRTDVCVAQTAIEAFYKGYQVAIVEDAVNSTTQREHEHGLSLMQINYGFETYESETALNDLLNPEIA